MSEMASRGKPEFHGILVSVLRAELSKVVSSIQPAVHKRAEGNGFRGNTREDIKRMSRNNVREVRDHGDAVPGVGSLIGRGVNGWCSMRKSRGRVRT